MSAPLRPEPLPGEGQPARPRGRGVLYAVSLFTIARELRRGRSGRAPSPAPAAADDAAGTHTSALERPRTLSGEEPPKWRGRWLLYLVGALTMAWGARGLVTAASDTEPLNWATFFVGGVVLHDLIFVPLVAAVVAVALHHIPAPFRRYAQGAVLVSGLVTLVALPAVLRLGERPDDPSTLPLPYGRNLLIVLAAVWAGSIVAALIGRRRRPATGTLTDR